jgi:hypothetical protein
LNNKKTVVLGASPNPSRFSHKAVKKLMRKDYEVVPVGNKKGSIAGKDILTGKPHIEDVHTVSLYIGSSLQEEYYDYVISLKPKRVIFNPGTSNPDFMARLKQEGIESLNKCMLLMLNEEDF